MRKRKFKYLAVYSQKEHTLVYASNNWERLSSSVDISNKYIQIYNDVTVEQNETFREIVIKGKEITKIFPYKFSDYANSGAKFVRVDYIKDEFFNYIPKDELKISMKPTLVKESKRRIKYTGKGLKPQWKKVEVEPAVWEDSEFITNDPFLHEKGEVEFTITRRYHFYIYF